MSIFRFGAYFSALKAWISVGVACFLSQAVAQRGTLPGDSPQRPPSPDLEIPRAPVLEPPDAVKSFVLPPGFRIEVVAAEPLVQDPVMMTFDARGRIWVAELPAYNFELLSEIPIYLDVKGAAPTRPVGRVVILEDTDGDGRADKRTVYADNLDVPRAIGFVGHHVLIGDPPNLWLTRDRDGDDVMDEKVLLASDYGTPDNIEQSPNGLLWGRDNWLYNANYKSRWRFVRGEWQREPMPALGQWGLTQDDFGRLFYNTNSDQLRGDLLPSHYAAQFDRRMPLYGFNVQLATDQSTWPARPTPGVNRGYREGQLREDGRLATFTAAAAPLIYRGNNFPERFVGNAFVPEPAGNLVKRNLLVETEGRIAAMHGYHGVEFLASTDERFRPVYLANAPDGTLFVVDYYRGFLEEYRFVTSYLGDQIVKRGLNKPLWGLGRIYRILYDGRERANRPDVASADPHRLVERLTDDNGWTRDTAQRQIVESDDANFVPALRALLGHAGKPRDRVSALWCLEGLQRLELADIEQGLSDRDSHVRIAALQAGEPLLRGPQGARLVEALRARVDREEPIVLAQTALALGGSDDSTVLNLLRSMLPRAGEHPALADCVLIAFRGHEIEVLRWIRTAMAPHAPPMFGAQPLLETLAMHLVRAGGAATSELVSAIAAPSLPQWCRLALMRGATRQSGGGLPESALVQLSETAVDAAIRRRASGLADAVRRRRELRASRPPMAALSPAQVELFEAGRTTYAVCASCHQPDGLGRPGIAPSLHDGRWTNAASPEAVIRIALHGKEGTPGYPAPMVPLASLTDQQLAGVLTYIRRSFGNNASAVEPAEIGKTRRALSHRANAWTDAELARIVGEQ